MPDQLDPRRIRRFRYVIASSEAGALGFSGARSIIGTWVDAPPPSFRYSWGGVGALNLKLPRVFGNMDESNEGHMGTLDPGRLVEVYITTRHGLSGYDASRYSGLCYRGFLSEYEADLSSLRITVQPIARVASEARIDSAVSGDTATSARSLTQTVSGLGWHAVNPDLSGASLSATYTDVMLTAGLSDLAKASGAAWRYGITPSGQVIFTSAITLAATSHNLAYGGELLYAAAGKSDVDRRKRVIVKYTTTAGVNGKSVAKADDWQATNPRDLVLTLSGQMDSAAAAQIASAQLAERNRVLTVGTALVSYERYDPTLFELGNRVRVRIPRRILPTMIDTTDLESAFLTIAEIGYEARGLRLRFGRPAFDFTRQTTQAGNRLSNWITMQP